ncbi:MAG TPA: hypothetical protein VHA11_04145, partial [Bryobacteraceae bacterium]|nr:hypothetical protein [Bryobacteraceae bacterium]
YMAALVCCISATRKRLPAGTPRDPVTGDLAQLSIALRTSLIAYVVSTCFISVAYNLFLPVLAALAVVLERATVQAMGSGAPARAAVPAAPRRHGIPSSRLGIPVSR